MTGTAINLVARRPILDAYYKDGVKLAQVVDFAVSYVELLDVATDEYFRLGRSVFTKQWVYVCMPGSGES
jgi:hypothetical protein